MQKQGYHIEKIIFESMPDFYVTAAMFIPDNRSGKTPAILYQAGHSSSAFSSLGMQKVILNLVKKGFIVFSFDPIDQGERLQYLDTSTGRSRIGGMTARHSYIGGQCFTTGTSSIKYFIWDGIRALDYLSSRQEVDPNRLGLGGCSGGGTQTAFIAAFDDRVYASAPQCYITNFHRLIQEIGPQDAEQNMYHGLLQKMDFADLLEVRAPKPVIIGSTTRDPVGMIQGARETANEVRKVYQAFGKMQNFQMVEGVKGHGTTQKTREAVYAFFQENLGLPGNSSEQPVDYLEPEALQITRTGEVTTSLGGQTVFDKQKMYARNRYQR